MNTLKTVVTSFVWMLLLGSCEKPDCQAPPPSYGFAFVDTSGQQLTDTTLARSVKLTYAGASGTPTQVKESDFKAQPSSPYPYVYEASYNLLVQAAEKGQNGYTVEIGGKPRGTLNLKTYVNRTPCNGWYNLAEVRYDNTVVNPMIGNGVTYVVFVTL
ncbi:hypothetical protein ACFQ4C_15735 [Larkinella insperata]|uniref:DUF4377 domain-containing protein n=1 Tax=Larkinella insperata TaxID=332158 RepID=A0ABW3Q601_9BACT|nr:hypothetical protein [Larkinella insperata]